MEIVQLSYKKTGYFPRIMLDYLEGKNEALQFVAHPFDIKSFEQAIANRKQFKNDRQKLHEVLLQQYTGVETNDAVKRNLELLRADTTFTVTTAHQPVLFTGPLYVIYKILSAINLAEKLKEAYPDFNFVPVYWQGGEDHDFEEVNHAHVFNKRLGWQHAHGGPVGKIKTDGIEAVVAQLKDILGVSERADEITELFNKAYVGHEVYEEATQYLVNELFGQYGLVIINPNHAEFKGLFREVMRDEILNERVSEVTAGALQKLNDLYKIQANPREINFFYLKDDMRERIVRQGEEYRVLNTDVSFSEEELLEEIEQHPERFSPNVMLRPLYQETVLPNIAYIGGGGELSYWMEQKAIFEYYNVPYPVLVLRNSVLWVDKPSAKKLDKLGIKPEELFLDEEELVKQYVRENTSEELSLKEEKEQLTAIYDRILEQAVNIDPTLKKTVEGEKQKQLNAFDSLEGKLLKAEKRKYDESIDQIRNLKSKLFPDKKLQERYDNFSQYYLRKGEEYFEVLKKNLNPLDKAFTIVVES